MNQKQNGGMNKFIKSQQELARKKMTQHTMWRDNEMKLLERHFDNILAQIITNTGEELMRKVEGRRKKLEATYRLLKEDYDKEYRFWFDHGWRTEKRRQRLLSFESGTEGNIMADCQSKIEAIDTIKQHITNVTGVEDNQK